MSDVTRPPNQPPTPAPPPRPPAPTPPSGPVADVERQLSVPLAILVAAVLDTEMPESDRAHLNAAANHVSLALTRLARIEPPARRTDCPTRASAVATHGGPGTTRGFSLPQRKRFGFSLIAAASERIYGRVEPS